MSSLLNCISYAFQRQLQLVTYDDEDGKKQNWKQEKIYLMSFKNTSKIMLYYVAIDLKILINFPI